MDQIVAISLKWVKKRPMGEVQHASEAEHPEGQPVRISATSDLQAGVKVVKAAAQSLPAQPGVYQMETAEREVLYVGKARVLRNRVASYAGVRRLPIRLQRMVAQVRHVEFTVTEHEAEALLLEANRIKKLRPRYNILLRDDKSYPYIRLRTDHPWPQLVKHRGQRRKDGDYFGPFASVSAVNVTLNALQRAFPLRTCTDRELETRKRPCLQYQIRRCSAPCVNKVSTDEYAGFVEHARRFLGGAGREVQSTLQSSMDAASRGLEFERAAVLRDRIRALNTIQTARGGDLPHVGDADVFAVAEQEGQIAVQVFFFRAGSNFGNRTHFPMHGRDVRPATVLGAFISQFYDTQTPPSTLLLNEAVPETDLLAEALSIKANRRVAIVVPQRGEKRLAVRAGEDNAKAALARRAAERSNQQVLLAGLAKAFDLERPPRRVEVYDNSHLQGAQPVGALIVAGPDGFLKASYRRFNVRTNTSGDDYAMMQEVLTRRFKRLQREDPDRSKGHWPDLVLIDGGAGHRNAALQAVRQLGIEEPTVIGVAKGVDRHAGREVFHAGADRPVTLAMDDPVMYFLQRLRDEAHRFAIEGHRAQRARAGLKSELDEVPGVGPRRKRALLLHFGSLNAIRNATLAELLQVDGINATVARTIHDAFSAPGQTG